MEEGRGSSDDKQRHQSLLGGKNYSIGCLIFVIKARKRRIVSEKKGKEGSVCEKKEGLMKPNVCPIVEMILRQNCGGQQGHWYA